MSRSLVTLALGIATTSGCGAEDACDLGVPGTVCRVAGTGEAAFTKDGKPAEASALYLPSQARRGPDGLLYVMDFNNHRLRRIEADGTFSTVAGDGFHAGATEGALAVESSLENPIDFDFLPDGRIVFVSYHDPRVLMVDGDGRLQVVAGTWIQAEIGNEGDGGPALLARFVELAGIAVAADGAIYVSDAAANRVRVIRDGTITTLAGTGVPGYAGDGALARAARLDAPTALAVDAAGAVYVSDSESCAVRQVTPDGMIRTVAGTSRSGFEGDGGPALVAALSHPDGIAVAADGALYIGDRLNRRVRRVDLDGTISTIAGTGEAGLTGDGGPATAATFGYVSRVQLDTDGGLLVVDQVNHAIRKILPAP